MIYANILQGTFLSRPNRFIAYIELDGKPEKCHVKNTGRCKELLIPGVKVFVQLASNPNRATKYDLIAVMKGTLLVNIDSQAPNKAALEWVQNSGFIPAVTSVKPEAKYGNSRLDLFVQTDNKGIYIEVKGVTLEEDGIALFPDAPTERGIKHLQELSRCIRDGFEAIALFVIQMKGVNSFSPNRVTHPAFGDALAAAESAGVKVLAVDCLVTENSMEIDSFIPVHL